MPGYHLVREQDPEREPTKKKKKIRDSESYFSKEERERSGYALQLKRQQRLKRQRQEEG